MEKVPVSHKAQIIVGAAVFRYDHQINGLELFTMLKNYNSRYGFPEGEMKKGETLWDAAIRETYEKTGMEIGLIGNQVSRYRFKTKNGAKELFVFPTKLVRGEARIMQPERFSGTMWRPMHHYANSDKLLERYVVEFAREPHYPSFRQAFQNASRTGIEKRIAA